MPLARANTAIVTNTTMNHTGTLLKKSDIVEYKNDLKSALKTSLNIN